MRIVISLIFICFNLVAIAQTKTNDIDLYINNIELNNDTINITLKIENKENEKISIIRFDREDICIHLLHFQIMSISDSTKNGIYPCDYVIDLDHVICNDSNCIKIDPDSSFVFELKYGLDEISPSLKKGQLYKMKAFIQLKDVDIRTTLENLYKGNAISNELKFKYLID